MNDDTDLTRLFAETAPMPTDEAFVARVTTRIVWRKRVILATPAALAALLLLAVWATWPAAYAFSDSALAGLMFMTDGIGSFFTSQTGMITAAALLLTGVLWAWLFEQMRGSAT